ncbi:MAG TPA: efflux transporter outer membrane subunit [Gemmataceae bacterium]|nr:efflux transporter outer membrane subunit [Gemmataceae bacterium]
MQSNTANDRRDGSCRSLQSVTGRVTAWPTLACLLGLLAMSITACGCTSVSDYIHNGFKVGPNYGRPPAPVAKDWIDADDMRVRKDSDDLSKWWTVFHDPVLESLICYAYQQNLSLRVAGFRVLEARAQTLIDVGNLFPQGQSASGDYARTGLSRETANPLSGGAKRWFGQWNYGFNLSWELDFWGRFRRAVESDLATLDASVENYDDVLVTLLGDVATNYTLYRTTELRIKYARENVELQRKTLQIVQGQFKVGIVRELDVIQARSTLEQTEAGIPELEIALRQTANLLCILLGIPPEDLQARLGAGAIPTAPPDVAVGVPADLLRRRPDVRRAERQAAAQCAQIGIAEAEFYPHIAINGTIGYSAENFKNLFREQALAGSVGPAFTWNILNYGRLVNNVRLQDARFQELVATYQNTVLSAAQDVENGLVTFLRAQQRTKLQAASVADADQAAKIAVAQYAAGTTDLTRVTQLEQNLVLLEDTLAQAQGEIATGLIQVYRALGGGWQIRCTGCEPGPLPPAKAAGEPEKLPAPLPGVKTLPGSVTPPASAPAGAPKQGGS